MPLILLIFLAGHLLFLPAESFSRQVVPFGLCPKYNPRIMYQLYQPFVDFLSENTPYRFEIKLFRSYQETIGRFGTGELQIASCGPVPYVISRERHGVKPLLRALNRDGKPFYRGIIIARRVGPIRTLADLKGRSFAFGQALSTAGHIVPQYHMMKAGVQTKDLKRFVYLRHHDSVVYAVLKGEVDAGAVKDIIAHRYQKEGLRFIFETDPIPTGLIAARPDAPGDLVNSVRTALLRLDPKNPADQNRIASWDEEFKYGFTQVSDSDYDPIRKILQAMNFDRDMRGGLQD
jgi:phosphonate transport system substrate-binding protein